MAVEAKRKCGYRKVGGLYLVGEGLAVPCDRLPLPITVCAACGAGIRVTRAPAEINPFRVWGEHGDESWCGDRRTCYVCYPPNDSAYLMGVGERYYAPQEFLGEAIMMGVSKRIPHIPRNLVPGLTPVYMAHRKAICAGVKDGKTLYLPGVIYAFMPSGVELLLWESEATAQRCKDEKRRGVRVIPIPDGDRDHA